MPSKSAKQHRFMQAVAHSPSFAKKAGVSQSVGKDFSAADKSKTFKKGDMMKKRYDNGGGVDFDADDDPESQKVFRDDDAGGLTELSDEERMPRRSASAPRKASTAPSLAASSSSTVTPAQEQYLRAREQEKTTSKREADEDKKIDTGASRDFSKLGRGALKRRRSEKELAQNAENTQRLGGLMATAIPVGRMASGAYKMGKAAHTSRRISNVAKKYDAERAAAQAARRNGKSVEGRMGVTDNIGMGYKRGGSIMESKKMMGKEVAFMKKKNAPKSMIKHEKAEMGMKFAKGGGIESRGKTKGTVIRMAAGGSVSARADGIAQRGKTKFKNY
jgi:hypothetical protein